MFARGVLCRRAWAAEWGRLRTRSARRVAAAVLGMLIATRSVASAQGLMQIESDSLESSQCVDSAAPSLMARIATFQYSLYPDTRSAISLQLDLVSQHVADGVRAALGAAPNRLPEGDTLADPRHVEGQLPLELVLHRDQPTTWRADSAVDSTRSKLVTLYLGVLKAMQPDALWIVWPPDAASDSIVLRFTLRHGSASQPHFAVFSNSTRAFIETPPTIDHQVNPRYPSDAEHDHATASVMMQFVIDTTGHADPGSITRVSRPPATGTLSMAEYTEFVDASRRAILASTYHPAHRGKCLVRARVRAPYNFASHQ